MRMTAKEMFEKLGYELKDGYSNIVYEDINNNSIIFWTHENITFQVKYISVKMLTAVNKQIEELGWND